VVLTRGNAALFDVAARVVDLPRVKARGPLQTRTQPTLNLLRLLRAGMVSMNIHPEGKSRGHVRYRFECLFSLTLLQGGRGGRLGGAETGAA